MEGVKEQARGSGHIPLGRGNGFCQFFLLMALGKDHLHSSVKLLCSELANQTANQALAHLAQVVLAVASVSRCYPAAVTQAANARG